MGFLDFLKPKPSKINNLLERMHANIFPKGEKDYNAVSNELKYILNDKISKEESTNIALKSIAISHLSENFDLERLKEHLTGYCIDRFNEKQLHQFYSFLLAIKTAKKYNNKTPSEIWRDGDVYYW
jgi:uncharacterized protein YozE (UPF0346 family)